MKPLTPISLHIEEGTKGWDVGTYGVATFKTVDGKPVFDPCCECIDLEDTDDWIDVDIQHLLLSIQENQNGSIG